MAVEEPSVVIQKMHDPLDLQPNLSAHVALQLGPSISRHVYGHTSPITLGVLFDLSNSQDRHAIAVMAQSPEDTLFLEGR